MMDTPELLAAERARLLNTNLDMSKDYQGTSLDQVVAMSQGMIKPRNQGDSRTEPRHEHL